MATQLPHPSPSLTRACSVQPPRIQRDYTPLHDASREGRLHLAKLLLANKADPNLQHIVTRGEGWEVAPMVLGADAYII